MIPLVHDFTDETVLVIGGGRVATRKTRRFAREATVVVVSPTFTDDLRTLASDAERVELVREALDPSDVGAWIERSAAALVIAATDNETVNAAAEASARERDVLVNRTDRSGTRDVGSVVVPATIDDDPVTVAITTGATSPALARSLRERIESATEGAGALAELTGEIRTALIDDQVDPTVRREAIRTIVRSPDVWKALQTTDANSRQIARRIVEEAIKGSETRSHREDHD